MKKSDIYIFFSKKWKKCVSQIFTAFSRMIPNRPVPFQFSQWAALAQWCPIFLCRAFDFSQIFRFFVDFQLLFFLKNLV